MRSVIVGQQPIKHNYYNQDDYLRYERERGTIVTHTGQRALHVSEDFIVALQAGLEEEVGDASSVIMYRMGYQWGLQDIRSFEQTMRAEFGRDVQEMNIQFALEQWWWPLQAMGWGAWQVDLTGKREEGLIVVDLFDSAVAKSLGEVGKPVCYLYAGLLAGVLTHLARRKLSGIEIQCYAMGASYCRFLVGSEKRINAVEFWLEEGATAAEILKRLA